MNKVKRLLSSLAYPLMAILTGLIIGAIIIMSTGKNPVSGIWGLLKGGYLQVSHWPQLLPEQHLLFSVESVLLWPGEVVTPQWVLRVK